MKALALFLVVACLSLTVKADENRYCNIFVLKSYFQTVEGQQDALKVRNKLRVIHNNPTMVVTLVEWWNGSASNTIHVGTNLDIEGKKLPITKPQIITWFQSNMNDASKWELLWGSNAVQVQRAKGWEPIVEPEGP